MNGDLLLGIDIGTSAVKVLLCDLDGRVVTRASEEYPVSHPWPHRAEQDPEQWWSALARATRHVLRSSGRHPGDVAALALSTQGGTLVPVDDRGTPTRPAILWTDTRCGSERELLAESMDERSVYDTTGWLLGTNLNLLQTLWLRRNEPDTFRRTRRFLSVPDYMAMRLTGRPALDVSNAGVNQFANFRQGAWDPALMELAGLSDADLGEILPAGSLVGSLTTVAADALGLPPGTPIVNGGHDQYCVALGTGARRAGDTFIGSGTAWVVAVVTDSPQPDFANSHCLSQHVVPGRFGALTSLESGGESLEWWRRLVARGSDLPKWDELAARLPEDTDHLPVYLPFLHGCTYPETSLGARGVLWGVEAGHDSYDVAAAVMAGVVFQTAWMMESFQRDHDRPLVLAGGAARSRYWTQLLADVVGAPVRTVAEPDAGAMGAALLAGSGVGLVDVEAVGTPALGDQIEPSSLSGSRVERFENYKRLATSLLGVVASDLGRRMTSASST